MYFDQPSSQPEEIGGVEIKAEMKPEDVQKALDSFVSSKDNLLKQIDDNIQRNSDTQRGQAWQRFRNNFENSWKKTAQETVGKKQDKILAAYKKLQVFDDAADTREFEELYGNPKNTAEFEQVLQGFEGEFKEGKTPSSNRITQLISEQRVLSSKAKLLGVDSATQKRLTALETNIIQNFMWGMDVRSQIKRTFIKGGLTEKQAEERLQANGGSRYREDKDK